MEIFGFEKAGLVVGDVAVLNADETVQFVVANVTPDRVDLLVDGEPLEVDLGPAEATNVAKRLVDNRYSDKTTFHTPREWNYEGVRLTDLVEGNTPSGRFGQTGATEAGRVARREVAGRICDRCFVAVPVASDECENC